METKLTFEQYQNALADNKLLGLLCKDCKSYTITPQAVCHSCGGQELVIKELNKTGIIKTFTVIRTAADGFTPPFIVAIVEVKDGACLMGNVIGVEPDSVDMELIGKKVEIGSQLVKGDLYDYGDIWSPTFTIKEPL
mmetsp:Transcript_22033/g.10407  ORF Transcript_22033/g.10407 Transcript_22033/m.10407 type:complete len:137 (+) Transcript_22033:217-627(+)